MNLCSEVHEEICYESRRCPVCEIIEDKNDQISRLEDIIAGLNDDVTSLNDQISEASSS